MKPSVIKQEMPASEAAKETKVTNVLPTTTEVKQEQPTKASKGRTGLLMKTSDRSVH